MCMYLSRTKEQKDSRTVFANNYYEIMSFFDYYTIRNNRRFYEKDIVYLSDEQNNDGKYSFNVHDETNNKTYRCLIGVGKKLNINEVHCDCNRSKYYGACNHIYYCFFYYSNIIFQERPEDVEVISKRLLKKYSTNISNVIQKEVFLTVKIFSNVYEDSDYVSFDLKVDIGVDKTYALLAHFSRFLSAYTDDTEECCFGTKFTYNSNEYFFSEKSKKLISLLSKHQYEINRKDYTKEFITEIIDLVKNDTFYFDNHIITKVVEGFPIKTLITKEDNKILVNFEEEDFVPVGDNYEYVYNSGTMYHLNQKSRKLIKDLIENRCDKLVINSNKLDTFVTTILPIIKKNTTVV